MMVPDVVACIVSHGQRHLLGACLEALRADDVPAIVLENIPDGSAALAASLGARASASLDPASFARNQNALIAATSSRYVLVLNPDCIVRPGTVPRLVAFADERPRAGVVGPRLLDPDGTLQRSRRRFPTVAGTLVRRTPLRLLRHDLEASQPGHYLSDLPTEPVECDWMLGACLLLRRAMLDELGGFDEGFPMYGEDIELQYRALRAGWQRWYVPDAIAVHEYQREIDRALWSRRSLWHLQGMARFVRLHPEAVVRRPGR
jgi:N-acetylglucosaminyl-diphospho-decaprenol L-rhamnosyltransferase